MKIHPVINVFSPNEVKIHLRIYYHSNITFGLRGLFLGSSITSHVDSLDRFIKSDVDKVKSYICIFLNQNHYKEDIIKINYAN